jgi:hypothetical protein
MENITRAIIIPANTSIAIPLITDVTMFSGVVTKLEILYPYGCAGLVGISFWIAEHQVNPNEINTWEIGNDLNKIRNTNIDLTSEPYRLRIKCYNLDELYPHTLQVTITINESVISPLEPIPPDISNDGFIANIINRAKRIK